MRMSEQARSVVLNKLSFETLVALYENLHPDRAGREIRCAMKLDH